VPQAEPVVLAEPAAPDGPDGCDADPGVPAAKFWGPIQGDPAMNRCILYLALILPGATALADDWPQWQGPNRNGISKEDGLLKEWPKDGPPLAWKAKGLGGGDSAPSVAGGKLFGMSTRGDDEVVWCLSEKDGTELWSTKIGPAVKQRMPQSKEGPGCTPTVDGERLYVLGMGGELACLQLKDGKILWQLSLTKEFGGRIPTWSYRESPLIDGDNLICTPGGADATIVALDKVSGKTVWKSAVPGSRGAAYASVIAIDSAGKRQYVQLTQGTLVGVAAADGKVLWKYDGPANRNGINCTTPIYDDGQVFASSAYGAGGGLVKLAKDGDGVKAEEVYFTRSMENHHGGLIVHEGCLYGAHGGLGGGRLVCLDFKTGKVLWDQRAVEKGSVAFADGRLYYRTESGTVLLIEPSAKEYVERGRFTQPDRTRAPAWAHPVVANGKLYIRDQDVLLSYEVKAK
jgi:outer membrane protein assembly factor BamB